MLMDRSCKNTYLSVITPWIPAKMGPAELQLHRMSGFSHTEEWGGVGWSEKELTGVGRYLHAINIP